MNVATIHHNLVKEAKRENKVWLREIKQLRPKSKGPKELVLVSAAPEPNRHDQRAFAANFNRNRRKFAHLVFNSRQQRARPTAHQMPKPTRLYRKSVQDSSLPVLENTIRLSPEGQLRLVELLNNPPPPTPAYLRAKETYERLFGKPV